ncbi:MAG: hypothetical protein ACOX2S_01385 [bacterium]|jgi:hypothetical protein
MQITLDEYIQNLVHRFSRFYDVTLNEEMAGQHYDLTARFKARNEKYILLREFTLFAYENCEIVLLKAFPEVTAAAVAEFSARLKDLVPVLVQPSEEHMSTVLTGVMVAQGGVIGNAAALVQRFCYSRNFRFLLQGWCDVRLLAVDLAANQVYSNKAGRVVQQVYHMQARKEGRGSAPLLSLRGLKKLAKGVLE